MVRVEAVEVFCGASDRFPQRRHQLGLFDVFGLERLGLVLSEQQRAQRGLPAQTLSPNHLEEEMEEVCITASKLHKCRVKVNNKQQEVLSPVKNIKHSQ